MACSFSLGVEHTQSMQCKGKAFCCCLCCLLHSAKRKVDIPEFHKARSYMASKVFCQLLCNLTVQNNAGYKVEE